MNKKTDSKKKLPTTVWHIKNGRASITLCLPWPHPYAGRNSTENERFRVRGISERKEQSDHT